MNRKLTLTGSILALICQVGLLVVAGYSGLITYILASLSGKFLIMLVVTVPLYLVSISGIVFNAFGINLHNKQPEVYKKNKWKIIVAIVLNFLMLAYLVYTIITNPKYAIVLALVIVVLLISIIFALVDIVKEKGKVQNPEQEEQINQQ